MNDFKSEPQSLRDAMLAATSRVFESGWYVLGNEVKSFEQEWSKICKTQHAIGVGNGMDAIEIALRSLDIGPGDEVITTPMTAFPTVLAIIRAGAKPVLADIEADTALLSIESVRRCITKKTRAVILVHLYGQVRDMLPWKKLCDDHQIDLIEDSAQSHLAEVDGRLAGSFGRAGAYSFYPTKNLGAVGDAGILITNDIELALRAKRLRNYGQSERYYHPELGMNSRLDELQAAILCERLKWLSEFTSRRQNIAQNYFSSINNPLIKLMAPPVEPTAHVYHLFVVTCKKRDKFQAHLKKNNVESLIHYPIPIHHQQPCHNIARDPQGLAVSEAHSSICLSLPCHPQMSDNDVFRVIKAVNSFRVDL